MYYYDPPQSLLLAVHLLAKLRVVSGRFSSVTHSRAATAWAKSSVYFHQITFLNSNQTFWLAGIFPVKPDQQTDTHELMNDQLIGTHQMPVIDTTGESGCVGFNLSFVKDCSYTSQQSCARGIQLWASRLWHSVQVVSYLTDVAKKTAPVGLR